MILAVILLCVVWLPYQTLHLFVRLWGFQTSSVWLWKPSWLSSFIREKRFAVILETLCSNVYSRVGSVPKKISTDTILFRTCSARNGQVRTTKRRTGDVCSPCWVFRISPLLKSPFPARTNYYVSTRIRNDNKLINNASNDLIKNEMNFNAFDCRQSASI